MVKNQNSTFDELPDAALIRQSRLVPDIVPLSRSELWKRVKLKTFPAPIKLSPRCTAWRVGDVRDWLKNPNKGDQND
jgi:prophage regulatory protein